MARSAAGRSIDSSPRSSIPSRAGNRLGVGVTTQSVPMVSMAPCSCSVPNSQASRGGSPSKRPNTCHMVGDISAMALSSANLGISAGVTRFVCPSSCLASEPGLALRAISMASSAARADPSPATCSFIFKPIRSKRMTALFSISGGKSTRSNSIAPSGSTSAWVK